MIKNSVSSSSYPSSLRKSLNVCFYNTLNVPGRGLALWKRESFFVDLTVNFIEIQHSTGPGIFGTAYTSTHTQVNIQKTYYTLRRLASSLARFDDRPGPLCSSISGHATCQPIISVILLEYLITTLNTTWLFDYSITTELFEVAKFLVVELILTVFLTFDIYLLHPIHVTSWIPSFFIT